jgi:hypothetical protein
VTGEIGDVFTTEEHGIMDPYELQLFSHQPRRVTNGIQKKKKAKIGLVRVRFSEGIWILWRLEELLQEGTKEEHAGDGAVGGEGHD